MKKLKETEKAKVAKWDKKAKVKKLDWLKVSDEQIGYISENKRLGKGAFDE